MESKSCRANHDNRRIDGPLLIALKLTQKSNWNCKIGREFQMTTNL